MNAFEDYVTETIKTALQDAPDSALIDVYAISLFVYDYGDDPRTPVLTLGYNTNERWKACTPAPGQKPRWPIASDSDEAKWNYAFWLHNELAVIGEPGSEGATLCQQWLRSQGLWYTDEELDEDEDRCFEIMDRMTEPVVAICISVVRALHAQGVITARFGWDVPVLIHELEYYPEIAAQTEEANPPGVAAEFVAWVNTSDLCEP